MRALVYNRRPRQIVERGRNTQDIGTKPYVLITGLTKFAVTPGGAGNTPGGATGADDIGIESRKDNGQQNPTSDLLTPGDAKLFWWVVGALSFWFLENCVLEIIPPSPLKKYHSLGFDHLSYDQETSRVTAAGAIGREELP